MSEEPFKCPICYGKGIVDAGFYSAIGSSWSSTNMTEKCRQCDGDGIVWGGTDVKMHNCKVKDEGTLYNKVKALAREAWTL